MKPWKPSLLGLIACLFSPLSSAYQISGEEFRLRYANPSHTIDFKQVRSGLRYEDAGTSSGWFDPYLYGFSVTPGWLGSTAYGVRSDAWTTSFNLLTGTGQYGFAGGVYWYEGGVAPLFYYGAGRPDPADPFYLHFASQGDVQPLMLEVSADNFSGSIGYVPDTDGTPWLFLSMPNVRLHSISYGFEELAPVDAPSTLYLSLLALAGLIWTRRNRSLVVRC